MKCVDKYFEVPENRYPIMVIAIEIKPSDLDVNLEPNKTKVFIKCQV